MLKHMKGNLPDRVSVYKETLDNWCPSYILSTKNYPNNGPLLVKVSWIKLPFYKEKQLWRVCIWGGDDLGMEIDFEEESSSLDIFIKVISEPTISFDCLKRLGFVYA